MYASVISNSSVAMSQDYLFPRTCLIHHFLRPNKAGSFAASAPTPPRQNFIAVKRSMLMR